MQRWNPYPFFRLIIPFVLGILASVYTDLHFGLPHHFYLVFAVLFMIPVMLSYFVKSWQMRWVPGMLTALFLVLAGFSLTVYHTPKYHPLNISNRQEILGVYLLRITEPLTEKENSYKTTGELISVIDSGDKRPLGGEVLIYFEKDSLANSLRYGDKIIVNARISEVSPPGNPHQFNYKRFLANSGIYHQVYISGDRWRKTGENQVNPVFQFAYSARHKLLHMLKKNGLHGDEYAVVSAILLGYDDFMDRELREKYAGAGALHVLCVSGLHVGIIFLILSFILKPLGRNKALRYLKMALLLVSIWAYAFITGLSPSVMRAGIMFSLFAWRESRREKSNPYNILAASAFILLAIDPWMITKIGFQLSYSAVLAIISLFNPIYSLMPVKNTILDYFWKLTVVSIAAQIGTFPFAIFYFHQFPTYFFITNIIVIPLVWLILNLGILVLVASAFSTLVSLQLSSALWFLLVALNRSVEYIDALPGSTLHGLVISFGQVLLIYATIILLSRAFITRNAKLVVAAGSVLVLLGLSLSLDRVNRMQQKEIIVYQAGRSTGIDFISGSKAWFLADSALMHDDQAIDFNISGNRIYSGVQSVDQITIGDSVTAHVDSSHAAFRFYTPGFVYFEGKRIALLGSNHQKHKPDKAMDVDVLILSGKPGLTMEEIRSEFVFKNLVLDVSLAPWLAGRWKPYCDSIGIRCHNVRTGGSFSMEIQGEL